MEASTSIPTQVVNEDRLVKANVLHSLLAELAKTKRLQAVYYASDIYGLSKHDSLIFIDTLLTNERK